PRVPVSSRYRCPRPLPSFPTRRSSDLGQVTLLMILVGIGTGPTLPLYTLIMQNAADPRDLGVVTSASMFSRSMGQVVGVTFFGVDRKSTRLNSSHVKISYAVFCLKTKT